MSDAPNFETYSQEDARLCMLKELNRQTDGRLNEAMLTHVIAAYGHNRSREWVRTQFRKMAELGAIELHEVGAIMIAEITRAGMDHVERRSVIEGIKRPSPRA